MYPITLNTVLATAATNVVNSDLARFIGDSLDLGTIDNVWGLQMLRLSYVNPTASLSAKDLDRVQNVLSLMQELTRDAELNRDICTLEAYFYNVEAVKDYRMSEGARASFFALASVDSINYIYEDKATDGSTVRGFDLLISLQSEEIELTQGNYADIMLALNAMFEATAGNQNLFNHVAVIFEEIEANYMEEHYTHLENHFAADAVWASTEPAEDWF